MIGKDAQNLAYKSSTTSIREIGRLFRGLSHFAASNQLICPPPLFKTSAFSEEEKNMARTLTRTLLEIGYLKTFYFIWDRNNEIGHW